MELVPAYRWIDCPEGAYLYYNYRGIARVVADGSGFRVVIRWRGGEVRGRAGSIAQGKRHIERWIEARGQLLPAMRPRPQVWAEPRPSHGNTH